MSSRSHLVAAHPYFAPCDTCLASVVLDATPTEGRAKLESLGWALVPKRASDPVWHCPKHNRAAHLLPQTIDESLAWVDGGNRRAAPPGRLANRLSRRPRAAIV